MWLEFGAHKARVWRAPAWLLSAFCPESSGCCSCRKCGPSARPRARSPGPPDGSLDTDLEKSWTGCVADGHVGTGQQKVSKECAEKRPCRWSEPVTQCAFSASKRNFLCHHEFILYLENLRNWTVSPVSTWMEVLGIDMPQPGSPQREQELLAGPQGESGGCPGHRPVLCPRKAVGEHMRPRLGDSEPHTGCHPTSTRAQHPRPSSWDLGAGGGVHPDAETRIRAYGCTAARAPVSRCVSRGAEFEPVWCSDRLPCKK